jgi:hypothetical protein
MPNQPSPDTVTVSFTLPRPLAEAVNRHAKTEMTNKSDIIRRALLAYLSPSERAVIVQEVSAPYTAERKIRDELN